MTRLFGTDGVRGTAGEPPLDEATILRLGAALVRVLPHEGRGRLLVGRDTRESGAWLEQAIARGVRAMGSDIQSVGVIPTPAVAYLTRTLGFDAGIVISASHNPYRDNGIKIFSGRGEKFDAPLEREIERWVFEPVSSIDWPQPMPVETIDGVAPYIEHARQVLPDVGSLRGAKIALDCANGATVAVAPRVFEALGFEVTATGDAPDGRNINLGCGSTHPERLSALVADNGYVMGAAFDGDGDRAILVDATGRIVDGDAIILLCARHLQRQGRLRGNAIVATVMSNIGLELALRDDGIDVVRCAVGDKFVCEDLLARGLSLGGEQSGHIILSDFLFTGDGIATALFVLRVMAESGRSLADLAAQFRGYPQTLVNVRVGTKRDLQAVPAVSAIMADVERRLAGRGRLLVRYSGTEPLLRIMIEGEDQSQIQAWAEEIATTARGHLS
ncbi:MAG: phosphoglucosamine mutase [Luteitalea sp.]|nr:phosphoglucosamine mutase [Luteitalea sp.]